MASVWRLVGFKTLTARLIAMVIGLVALSVTVPLLLVANSMRQELVAQASNHLVTIATYVADDIGREILIRRMLLEQVADTIGVAPDDAITQVAVDASSGFPALFPSGMVVLDAAGRPLVARPANIGADGGGAISPELLKKADDFVLGRPVIGRISDVAEMAMAVPARDAAGRLRAIVVGIAPLQSTGFLGALYSTRVGHGGGLALVSVRDQMFLGASDEPNALKPLPSPGIHAQHDHAMAGIYGVGIGVRAYMHIEELAATTPVPGTGWFLVARIPTEELFAAARRFDRMSLVASGLALVLVLMSSHLLLRRLLGPLRRAAKLADRMSDEKIAYAPLPVENGDEVGHLTSAFNKLLENLLASRDEFKRLAHTDALTGVANRAAFDLAFVRYLSRARRHHAGVSVLFFDLDDFKSINDRFGHEAGDAVLTAVAQRLLRESRHEDFVARIGGDEFALLVDDVVVSDDVFVEMVGRYRRVIAQPIRAGERDIQVSVSIGQSCYPRDGDTPESLLTAADQAMYRDKYRHSTIVLTNGRDETLPSDMRDGSAAAIPYQSAHERDLLADATGR